MVKVELTFSTVREFEDWRRGLASFQDGQLLKASQEGGLVPSSARGQCVGVAGDYMTQEQREAWLAQRQQPQP